MNSIVKTIELLIYEPIFNVESDSFEDACPYRSRERGRSLYTCRCKAGTEISNIPQYRSHINSSCHKNYIENYSFFKKEVIEEKEFNKKLKYSNEILTRKLNKKSEEYNVLESNHNKLESNHNKLAIAFKKYCDKSKKQNTKFFNILNDIIQEDD